MEKVVITGMGGICSLGKSIPEIWSNLINGVSGAGEITLFDSTDLLVKIACEVKDFIPAEYISARDARRRDRHQIFAAIAVKEALSQSGIDAESVDPERVGIVISSSVGGIAALEKNSQMELLDKQVLIISSKDLHYRLLQHVHLPRMVSVLQK